MNKKTDLRVIKTENLIRSSFIELVQTIGYQRITIKDLCEKAMINRNTFYLHYSDKDDLIKSMINEAFDKYSTQISGLSTQFYNDVLSENYDGFYNNIRKFLSIIFEDVELYRMMLLDEQLSGYFNKFQSMYEKTIFAHLKTKNKRAKIIFRYIMGGVSGIIVDWIVKDTSSLDETAEILSKLIFENIKIYITENRR